MNPNRWTLVLAAAAVLTPSGFGQHAEPDAAGEPERVTRGAVQLLWRCPGPGADAEPREHLTLVTEHGETLWLDASAELLEPLGGRYAVNGRRVTVRGRLLPGAGRGRWQATAIDDLGPAGADAGETAGTVSRPFINILVRFAGNSATPATPAYFNSLFATTPPGLNHYFRELSYNEVNLDGTATVGWFNLPQPRSYYVYDDDGDGGEDLNFDRLLDDAIAVADAGVFFPNYFGINICANDSIDACCAWGGSRSRTIDGQTRTYGVTWLPPWGYQQQAVLAHEIGHTLGWPHSSGPYGEKYDSRWDVMSGGGTCTAPDPTHGCLGNHTIGFHKADISGWIPAARRFDAPAATTSVITLHRISTLAAANYMYAKIPISGTRFYTAEVRRFFSYDNQIPFEGVLLNDVVLNRPNGWPAWVVDPDNDNDPNDDSAAFLPGEAYHDAGNAVLVKVLGPAPNGYVVGISRAPRNPCYGDAAWGGTENGTVTLPFNTVNECVAAVVPGGTIRLRPGTYAENLVIRHACNVVRNATSGVVTIGN